jgi:hypothetical protein
MLLDRVRHCLIHAVLPACGSSVRCMCTEPSKELRQAARAGSVSAG